MQSEISQTDKGKYCMISLTCGVKKKFIGPENRLAVVRGGGREENVWIIFVLVYINWFKK